MGLALRGSTSDADRGYDADYNFGEILWMGMVPNIRQRAGAVNEGKPDRKKAAAMFDSVEYRLWAPIGVIYGAGGGPAAPFRLQVNSRGQPAPVRQGQGNRLEYAGPQQV